MNMIKEARKASGADKPNIAKRLFRHENATLVLILAVLIGVLGVLSKGKTLSVANVRSTLVQSSIRGVSAVGQAFVILTAGIDLSVNGVALMAICIGASFITTRPAMNVLGSSLAVGVAVPLLLLIGIGMGALNGLSVSRIGMPPLIVTLAMWRIAVGISWNFTSGRVITQFPESLRFLGQGNIGGMPTPVFIFIVVVILAYFVLSYTTFGKQVYGVGGNLVASWLSGVKVQNVLLSAYTISGLLAALAGVLTLSRGMTASLAAMSSLELDTIAAVVVGGVSLVGGRGSVIGVMLGAFILGVVTNGTVVLGMQPAFQDLLRGAIIFGAVVIDSIRRRG